MNHYYAAHYKQTTIPTNYQMSFGSRWWQERPYRKPGCLKCHDSMWSGWARGKRQLRNESIGPGVIEGFGNYVYQLLLFPQYGSFFRSQWQDLYYRWIHPHTCIAPCILTLWISSVSFVKGVSVNLSGTVRESYLWVNPFFVHHL